MSIFFKAPIDIEILLDGEESRNHIEVSNPSGSNAKTLTESMPVFEDGETVSGIATLRVRDGKRVEHAGIKVSIVGSIDLIKGSGGSNGGTTTSNSFKSVDSRKKSVEQFLCLTYDLCPAGELQHSQSFPFNFKNLPKRHESYKGKNVDVSYYVKVTLIRKGADISKIKKFWVNLYLSQKEIENLNKKPVAIREEANKTREEITKPNAEEESLISNESKPVKLDIGIENCLHIEFEYAKSAYSLKDVIVGRIYFLLSRLKIKHMEVSLITRESAGVSSASTLVDSTAIRYEIMDGSPVKGETIPIRLFLSGYELTPNMGCNYFNVKNYLSLVIIDEDGRRYFKQSEITLYRQK
ncbi:hypothetical protein Kpol_1066p14 [Vanderwaltozyma polyspora DSM 70294]|uniref:Vacuolar protein sorting-associated protein 26 n=1 Tax=Vanderwaltozyma polyspora (strain ATCC 22028 / DSM 70294 / BCRC 21397 / CBS 2163 / NBRC 10782 / NRRL Y-8283 / UCD 57-17) TaxID=436907 RepID=A7TMN6_VANPO|nr:uncharacterized protein Kpol_1066p14 [Vanderwaltozyma polyspora DSM 70294]EDO16450.1 hypothetical protein Kpol_1066p14 [Vanderwaltozyma polyspora DSM 70294]